MDEVLDAVMDAVGTSNYTAGATTTGTLTSTDTTGATPIVLSSSQDGALDDVLGLTLDAADTLSTATQDGAKKAILALDTAISTVSAARANIGSLESRFGFHQASIATSIENLTAAVSAIKDTDVASEAAKLASAKVKTQAAVAAAAQASQMPQDLLKLLQ